MNANVYDEDRAPDLPQRNELGKPKKPKAPIKVGSAAWLVAALLLLSAIPLAAGTFRLIQLAGGAAITPANARFFASPLPVVVHIVGAELSYVERVNGKLPAQPLAPEQFPGFAVLKDAVRWAGDELLQLALSARKDTSVRQRPPRQLFEYKLASLMVQAVSHSTEHRTQISAIITQLGMEPPDMSGWQYMDELGELRELGAEAEGAA